MLKKEYIEREALLNDIEEIRPLNWTDTEAEITEQADFDWFESLVKSQPISEVQEVRHGRWEYEDSDIIWTDYKCSICGNIISTASDECELYLYCPYCGAKMDMDKE